MPKFVIKCSSGWCNVNDTVIVEADDESEAEDLAREWWEGAAALEVVSEGEATDEDLESGYDEI